MCNQRPLLWVCMCVCVCARVWLHVSATLQHNWQEWAEGVVHLSGVVVSVASPSAFDAEQHTHPFIADCSIVCSESAVRAAAAAAGQQASFFLAVCMRMC